MAILSGAAERRAFRRLPLDQVPQIVGVRITSERVDVINVSAGGLLVESTFAIRPGLATDIEVLRPNGKRCLVAGLVLRCEVASLGRNWLRYRVAVAFDAPLGLIRNEHVVNAETPTTPVPDALPTAMPIDYAEAATQEPASLNNW
jgi:hypothetical protein